MIKTKHLFLKLLVLLVFGVGWSSSAWAEVQTGIYRIASSKDDRGFLIDKGNYATVGRNRHQTSSTIADNSNSLWYVYKTGTSYYIASLANVKGNSAMFLKGTGNNNCFQSSPVAWEFTSKGTSSRHSSNTAGYDTSVATPEYFEMRPTTGAANQFLAATPGYANEWDRIRFGGTEVAGTYWEFQSVEESVLSSAQTTLLNTIKASFSTVTFTVIITGDKKDDEEITYKNNKRFASAQTSMLANGDATATVGHNETLTFKPGIQPGDLLDCDFTSSAESRTNGTSFVYGPVIDWVNHTITCEIREAITALPETGWYQLKWDVSTNNVDPVNRYSQAREDDNTNPIRDNNRFYLTMPRDGRGSRTEYMGYRPYPSSVEDVPLTFVKLVRNGNNIQMMSVDGRYVLDNGNPSTSGSGENRAAVYVADGEIYFPNWFPFAGLNNIMGKASNTRNYYYVTPAKFDDSRYDFYEAYIHYEGVVDRLISGSSITYNGSATNYSMNTVYAGGYFVFPKGASITNENFTVNGVNTQDIKSVSLDPITHKINVVLKLNLPGIVHRRPYFYDKITAENKPGYGHIGQNGDDGWVTRKDGIKEQKTAEYHIPVYLKPGNDGVRQLYLPTTQVKWYQRWYDYTTDGLIKEDVMPALYSGSRFKQYSNGHVSGSAFSGFGYFDTPNLILPTSQPKTDGTFYDDYVVGLDLSRFKDNETTSAGDLKEPTLSQRVIFEIKDANRIATELTSCTGTKWLESRTIIFPTVKRGAAGNSNTHQDVLPLNMDLWNYWVYNSSHNLVQLTTDSQIEVDLENNTAGIRNAQLIPGSGGIVRTNFNQGHFIRFEYPESRIAPDNSKATICVYFKEGSNRYQLAKFDLTFMPNTEPKLITEVIGKNENGTYKNERSPFAMEEKFGHPVAEITFDNKRVLMKNNLPQGGIDNTGNQDMNTYLFPLDFSLSSYAYGFERGDGTSRGEYSIYTEKNNTSGGNHRYHPVQKYYDLLNGTNTEANQDQFFVYVDASDQAGEVLSVSLNNNLCAGTRLYFTGWMGSTAGGGNNPASILINIVGTDSGTKESKILTSYCPGMLSSWTYTENDQLAYCMDQNTGNVYTTNQTGKWMLWNQVGFSFLLDAATIAKYDTYTMQIVSNCFNSSGADYVLDNFQIFANPPKGEVDFTTPLCSDKVRHAKIHTDFDMLKDLSNVNETDPNAKLFATFCFLDAEIFDNFVEGSLKISEMFETDDKGNHNLKPEYDENDTAVQNIINHAFRQALVGSRYIKSSGKNDYGFHSFEIPVNFESIPAYAYKDSKEDVVYSEVDDQGIRRVVFKENVVRGEMQMVPAETVNGIVHPAYWPYMRPSRTYYLVFSPIGITAQNQIDKENTATQIFSIQDDCSFFGKFTTKDPMHVILDNADIESDIPVQAVCHGETIELEIDVPDYKKDKPIVDEAYCTSDENLNGTNVPSTNGLKYRYEPKLNTTEVKNQVNSLQYDWWVGGKFVDKDGKEHKYSGTIGGYLNATHPTNKYRHDNHEHTHAENYKADGEPVDISHALQDFRFFYPDFVVVKGATDWDAKWSSITTHDYNNDSGYSLLQSEINSLKDFVNQGIIVLKCQKHSVSLAILNKDELSGAELSKMVEDELSVQILELTMKLGSADLVSLESKVLDKLSAEGRKKLTLEEFGNMTYFEMKVLAKEVLTTLTPQQIDAMTETTLRNKVEEYLNGLAEDQLRDLAKDKFPYLSDEERAYLIVRALNLLSKETVKHLSPEDQVNSEKTRPLLKTMMIDIFKTLSEDQLRQMWNDTKEKLTEEERTILLDTKNPDSMSQQELAELVEGALAKITDKVITTLRTDKHFTLVPIMPTQDNFVDEPYIFCPEPRGIKVSMRDATPKMYNGFGNKTYPTEMKNVPVRAGVQQLDAVSYDFTQAIPDGAKTLRIPLRGLIKAIEEEGRDLKPYEKEGTQEVTTVFLVDTNDSVYEDHFAQDEHEEEEERQIERAIEWGKITNMVAKFEGTDNYMDLVFNKACPMREGYTYRIGVRFVEYDENDKRDIACDGILYFDLKVVPEYMVWTGTDKVKHADNATEWTNDRNWARADRSTLLSDGTVTGSVVSQSTQFDDTNDSGTEKKYPTNELNFGKWVNPDSLGFAPLYFTNVLFNDSHAKAPVLVNAVDKTGTGEGVGFLTQNNHQSNRSGFENHTMHNQKAHLDIAYINNDADAKNNKVFSIVYDMTVAPIGESSTAMALNNRYTTAFNAQSYMCETFGTNVAKGVTFAPQTQLINAQYLNYYKAWVEYELDVNRWYTLGSPLQNTFAGEWYAPTAGAKQKSPYFYDIEYQTNLNDRFRPAIYQRSWDSKDNVPVYVKHGGANGTSSFGGNNEPAYVKADWSYVYNDVKKQYSNGGFSVKINTDLMQSADKPKDDKSIIRMPKADTQYTYYDSDHTTGEKTDDTIAETETEKRGRLWSDELANNTSFTQTINNREDGNNFFLVNNPFIANMDMDKFFEKNTQFVKKYWIMTAEGQIVKVQVNGTNGPTWITNAPSSDKFADKDAKVGPLQGFFVTQSAGNTAEVKFTAAMQEASAETAKELKSRPAAASSIQTLAMTAQRGDFTSTAVVAISNGASKEYVSSEDCETFIDSDIADQPTIYTVASGQAMTVNTVSSFEMIAVGILGKEGDEADVTFSGISETLFLYDSKEGSYVEIQDGTELQMACGAAGRYFITASPTAIEEVTDNDRIRMGVWSVNGTYCGDTTEGLAPGLYIVDGVKMNIR